MITIKGIYNEQSAIEGIELEDQKENKIQISQAEGNNDLIWLLIRKEKEKRETTINILKSENIFLYKCIKEVLGKLVETPYSEYNLIDNGIVCWKSDGLYYPEGNNELKIKSEENKITLNFIAREPFSKATDSCGIIFCNSGSRYGDNWQPFYEMYQKIFSTLPKIKEKQ